MRPSFEPQLRQSQMLKSVQISCLLLFAVVIAAAIWLLNWIGSSWGLISSTLITYVTIVSVLLFGSPDGLTQKALRHSFVLLLGDLKRSLTTLSSLVILTVLLAVLCWGVITDVKENLFIQIYDGRDDNGVLATINIRNKFAEESHDRKTDNEGFVGFEITNQGLWQMILSIDDIYGKRSTNLPAETLALSDLPKTLKINIRDITSDKWQVLEFPKSRSESLVAIRSAPPEFPNATFGDKSLSQQHSPWGVPRAEIIIYRHGYVVGFHPDRRLLRWVAYKLTKQMLDNAGSRPDWSRRKRWRADPKIDADQQSSRKDYSLSGYDFGSMVTYTSQVSLGEEAANQSLYYTVISPQTPMLNRAVWHNIERYARDATLAYGEVWLITGPLFMPKSPSSANVEYLTIGRTPVPTHYFLILAKKTEVSGVDLQSFVVPNVFTFDSRKPESFFVSVESIEEASALDFFADLPEQAQFVIETIKPKQFWEFPDD